VGKKAKELVWMEMIDRTTVLRQESLGGEEFINTFSKQEEITHQLKVTKSPATEHCNRSWQ